jgi:hypothetical protein
MVSASLASGGSHPLWPWQCSQRPLGKRASPILSTHTEKRVSESRETRIVSSSHRHWPTSAHLANECRMLISPVLSETRREICRLTSAALAGLRSMHPFPRDRDAVCAAFARFPGFGSSHSTSVTPSPCCDWKDLRHTTDGVHAFPPKTVEGPRLCRRDTKP